MSHSEWPMTAAVERLNDKGEWEHYSQISTVKDAEVWIAKRSNPAEWRAVALNREVSA